MPRQDSKTRISDQIRRALRLHPLLHPHRTEYLDWSKSFVAFRRMKSHHNLAEIEKKVEAFFTQRGERQ